MFRETSCPPTTPASRVGSTERGDKDQTSIYMYPPAEGYRVSSIDPTRFYAVVGVPRRRDSCRRRRSGGQ